MSFELPLERSIERQARPKAVFGRLNPGRGLGDASKLSGGMPLPKLGGLKKLAKGGIVGYADGGDYQYDIPYLNSPGAETLPMSPVYHTGSSDDNPQVSAPSADMGGIAAATPAPLPDPAMTNTSFNRDSEGLGARLANQGVNYTPSKNGYSYDTSGKAVDPNTGQELSGFQGWLGNKHALGVTGSDWLKAALTAATGILGQAVAKRNNKLALQAVAPPAGKTMIAPAIGVNPQGYAGGGEVRPWNDPSRPKVTSTGVGINYADQAVRQANYDQIRDAAIRAMSGNSHGGFGLADRVADSQNSDAAYRHALAIQAETQAGYAGGGAMAQPIPPQQAPAAPQGPGQPQGGPQDQQSQAIVINAAKALMGQMDPQSAQAALQAFVQAFGQEALQQLAQQIKQSQGGQQQQGGIAAAAPQQGMATGGALYDNQGDGMSDSIPANNGQVALSGGEHILDASTVSQAGNGDTEAGHRKIEHAVKALRQKKFGGIKQPPRLADSQNPVLKALS